MKKLAYLLMLVPLVAGGWIIKERATFDRADWIADFEQLKSATEQNYANLRWTRSSKQVDLVALNAATLEQLEQATSPRAARAALANFIRGFNDGHFHIESGPPKPVASLLRLFDREDDTRIDLAFTGSDACKALGFSRKRHTLGLDGATELPNATFAAGTVSTASGRKFGVLRIPLFRQYEYGAICERAWQQFAGSKSGECDEGCQDEFSRVAKHEVAQALADDAHALIRSGAEAVVIDLTGNGGGTEWAEFAAAALSDKPIRSPDVAFIRAPHWERSFRQQLEYYDGHLRTQTDSNLLALVREARVITTAMLDSARVRCDLHSIWSKRSFEPACWNVVQQQRNNLPGDDYAYERPFGGRVYIMMDQRTASASEQFAATLVDNGVARTLGTKTMGVGCGFTNGGNPITLEHSKLVIWMPDCARLRQDGSNEFEGIKPDYEVDWGSDGSTKTRALLDALDSLPRM